MIFRKIKSLLGYDWSRGDWIEPLRSAPDIASLGRLESQVRGFNQQVLRLAFITALADYLKLTAFVETGTHLGQTSIVARHLFLLPVYTVEAHQPSY